MVDGFNQDESEAQDAARRNMQEGAVDDLEAQKRAREGIEDRNDRIETTWTEPDSTEHHHNSKNDVVVTWKDAPEQEASGWDKALNALKGTFEGRKSEGVECDDAHPDMAVNGCTPNAAEKDGHRR